MIATWTSKNNGDYYLSINRRDGTSTYSKLHANLPDHDLAHYAVEKNLQFKNAFFGLVNAGVDITDFMMDKDKKPPIIHPDTIHPEAITTEHIVNLLQLEFFQNIDQSLYIGQLRSMLEQASLPFPTALTDEKIQLIREDYHQLSLQLRNLKPVDKIDLPIDWL